MTLEFLVRPEYMISKNDNKSIIFHIIMTIQVIIFHLNKLIMILINIIIKEIWIKIT